MKVEVVRRVRARLPNLLTIPGDVLEDIGKVGEASIVQNIMRQRQADDSGLKRNKESTRERKRRQGNTPIRSLIDKFRRFVKLGKQSWSYEKTRQSVIISPATQELRRLSRWVQEKGYTGWFGLNKRAYAAIRARLRKWIRSEFAKMKRR